MKRHIQSIRVIFVALLLCCGTVLEAQTITGSVKGTVTDPTGAVIPNAKVTATNVDTGIETPTTTNGDGIYNIAFLQIGNYKVKVEAPGFAPADFGPFALETGQIAKVDAKLLLSGHVQNVSVAAELIPLLNTENGTLGTTLDSTAIDNVPLNGRNFASLTVFMPGAVTSQPSGLIGSNAIERSTSSNGQASVNGNRQQTNNFLLDGIEINETINNTLGYNPSPDALGQVRVIASNAQAEYGNVNGGDVIALLKSGTNLFHGSAYYYLENYNLDANSWANKNQPNPANIIPKSSYTQNIFGGTLGGPIIKDKLFFFGDYSGVRYHLGGITTASVPTALMRQGDFSELLNPALITKPIQLYDAANKFSPYVGNKNVPILNPVAKYLYANPAVYPLPNVPALPGTVIQNNYQGPTKTRRYNDQFDVKLDWKATQLDQVSGRYSQSNAGDTQVNPLAITFPGASTYPTKSTAINWVHTINPAIVNEFRAGFTRIRWEQGYPLDTTGVFGTKGNSIIGIPGPQTLQGFSAQNFSTYGTNANFTNLNIGNQFTGTSLIVNTFTYGDNLTWSTGRHLIKMGAQFIRYQQNSYYPGNDGALGNFSYSGNFTSNPGVSSTSFLTNGYTLADFNLDRVYYEGQGALVGRTGQRQWRNAFFVQDDFKFMPNLTLNLGIRYEYDQPIYEVNNKQANVDFATKTVIYAGQNGASRALYNPSYNNLMPRLGFAYSPTTRFVVRGGYGITTYMEGTGANLRLNYNPPFINSFIALGAAPSTTGPGTSFKTESGFANGAAAPVTQLRAWDKNLKPAFISEYSLTTEYQFSNSASLTLGYVGENGQHLITAGAGNQLAQPCVIGGVVSSTPSSAACQAVSPAPFANLVGQGGNVVLTASNAMMNYNAMQATFRQRGSRGLSYTVNYSYGRAMTNSIGFFGVPLVSGASAYAENFYNNHAEYGPAGQDVRHNLNGTAVYELPFGRGHLYGANMNRFADEVVGGWKVAMTAIDYSGFPITISTSSNNAYTNNKTQRANHYRPLKIVNRNVNQWFGNDPSVKSTCSAVGVDNGVCAYGQPAAGTYGTATVGSERAPGFQQYDFSGFKDFAITERQKISFRVDASNAFNITSLGNPDRTAQNATFGKITSVRSIPRQLQLSAKYQF